MKIKQYDRVMLKDGSVASIVEIFDGAEAFIADVDRNGDTYTEEIKINDIDRKI